MKHSSASNRIIALAALALVVVVVVAVPGEKNMIAPKETARIEAYVQADAKYIISPVPTPVEARLAAGVANSMLAGFPDAERTERLARMAVLLDLRDTAAGFQHLLRVARKEGWPRSAPCLFALAWLGNPEQLAEARQAYSQLLAEVDWSSQQELVLRVANSLSPQEPAGSLQGAVNTALGSLRAQINDARHRGPGSEATVEALDRRYDRLEEFARLDLPHLESAAEVRRSIEAKPEEQRVPELCALYLANSPAATPAQAEWAAYRLVRLTLPIRPRAVSEFLKIAETNVNPSSKPEPTLDLARARALRAAEYFGGELDKPSKQWLMAQRDAGTDLLALRPDWEYLPAPDK